MKKIEYKINYEAPSLELLSLSSSPSLAPTSIMGNVDGYMEGEVIEGEYTDPI